MPCSLSRSRLALVSPDEAALQAFWEHQCQDTTLRFEAERVQLERLLSGISLLGECSPRTADELVSYGEVLSSQYVAQALKDRGYEAVAIDSGDFLVTDAHYGSARSLPRLARALSCALCWASRRSDTYRHGLHRS